MIFQGAKSLVLAQCEMLASGLEHSEFQLWVARMKSFLCSPHLNSTLCFKDLSYLHIFPFLLGQARLAGEFYSNLQAKELQYPGARVWFEKPQIISPNCDKAGSWQLPYRETPISGLASSTSESCGVCRPSHCWSTIAKAFHKILPQRLWVPRKSPLRSTFVLLSKHNVFSIYYVLHKT